MTRSYWGSRNLRIIARCFLNSFKSFLPLAFLAKFVWGISLHRTTIGEMLGRAFASSSAALRNWCFVSCVSITLRIYRNLCRCLLVKASQTRSKIGRA
jgi:hypothetical protein